MMFGEYPCCDGSLCIAMPDKTPTYYPEECPHCGAKVWHEFSRIQPRTYMEADFLKEFDVDPVAKTVKRKPTEMDIMLAANPELKKLHDEAMERAVKAVTEQMEHAIIHGTGNPNEKCAGLLDLVKE